MPTEQKVKIDFSPQLQILEEEYGKEIPDVAVFASAYRGLNEARLQLQRMVESAAERSRESKDFQRLHARIAGQNATQLIERLSRTGYFLKKEKPFREAFERQGYRLLEQTRAGKRDDVYHGILRIFISLQKDFPLELVEVFKPVYSDEMFKVFLFSFLSGVLGKQEESE
jgi:hypothetical protein